MSVIDVGILGIGTYLPTEVRKNDFWPERITSRWTDKRAATAFKFQTDVPPATEGIARVMAVFAGLRDDPFQGAVERRVLPDAMMPSEMELRAATEAVERSGVAPSEIDLLVHSAVPDALVTNNGCLLHHRLGLPSHCFTMATDSACNSFIMQLVLAQSMIASGQRKHALLVQSCAISRILDIADPVSPLFGDGATAVVVGPVSGGTGVLASAHRTDGSLHRALVAGVRDKQWYDDGHVRLYSAEPAAARRTFLEIADRGKDVVDDVLGQTGNHPGEVSFFGVHQGTSWARALTRLHFGLHEAKSVETFAWAASIFAGNIPLSLAVGEREGMIRGGDLVLLFAGGAGLTYSSALLRWGR